MAASEAKCTVEAVIEAVVQEAREERDPPPRTSTLTEADKIRRQLHLRRKTKLARQALTASRSR
jgi:hypothetical protein